MTEQLVLCLVVIELCLSVCLSVCLCISLPQVPSLWDTACVCLSVCVSVSLPQVPSLWDTACVCVDLPRDDKHIRHQLVEAVRDYGRVLSRAPVQITDISERPAALLVHWAEVATVYYNL